MAKSGLPSSIRKFIRREKNRIRREYFGLGEQQKKVEELYKRFGFSMKPEGAKPVVSVREPKSLTEPVPVVLKTEESVQKDRKVKLQK